MRNILVNSAQETLRKMYRNIVNTLCNNENSDLTFQYKYSKMAMQINDIDLDYISILQTEYGNTSDITINCSSDASSIGTIIYDHNLHNDCDQVNTPWGKTCQRSRYYIVFYNNNSYIIILILLELYLVINIILIIKLILYSYLL